MWRKIYVNSLKCKPALKFFYVERKNSWYSHRRSLRYNLKNENLKFSQIMRDRFFKAKHLSQQKQIFNPYVSPHLRQSKLPAPYVTSSIHKLISYWSCFQLHIEDEERLKRNKILAAFDIPLSRQVLTIFQHCRILFVATLSAVFQQCIIMFFCSAPYHSFEASLRCISLKHCLELWFCAE